MGLEVESRPSDSPYVERVWRSRSHDVDRMTSIATSHGELAIWEHRGQVGVAVRGPESRASAAPVPEEATFFGITFALGASMPHLPADRLVDGFAEIPDAARRSFWLKGSAWHLPDYDNAEEFVRRLVREGVLDRDPIVADVLRGAVPDVSERTVQRRASWRRPVRPAAPGAVADPLRRADGHATERPGSGGAAVAPVQDLSSYRFGRARHLRTLTPRASAKAATTAGRPATPSIGSR